MHIHIVNIVDIVSAVIVIRDVSDVSNVRVCNVYVLEVTAAVGVVRNIWLTPAQREPAHASAHAERQAKAPAIAADPPYQCRRVNGT